MNMMIEVTHHWPDLPPQATGTSKMRMTTLNTIVFANIRFSEVLRLCTSGK